MIVDSLLLDMQRFGKRRARRVGNGTCPFRRMHTSSHVLSRIVAFAALAALVGSSWQHLRTHHRRRLTERPLAAPVREQVWEGEGGQNQMPGEPVQEIDR